ncbi:hypothetical protein PR048_001488 [Dryococelus australis]|uniref:Uncharacterized protein n=1 Tax=Dryococelus australis TaxID=614101 RepID=A0ABQ9IHI0_9NEOP|nr:hypothetical protein PR048_001488 [Dryococelus australis]
MLAKSLRTCYKMSQKELSTIAPQERMMIQQLCQALKPFMDVTKISGETYTTASLVIVMVCGLTDKYCLLRSSFVKLFEMWFPLCYGALKSDSKILNSASHWLCEQCTMLDIKTLLLPVKQLWKTLKISQMVKEDNATTNSTSSSSTIQHVADTEKCSGASKTRGKAEVQRYLEAERLTIHCSGETKINTTTLTWQDSPRNDSVVFPLVYLASAYFPKLECF